jgi:hypothetical protein
LEGAKVPAIVETARYIIIAKLPNLKVYSKQQQQPRTFLSILEVDEYKGWLHFHCTMRSGAIGLKIQQQGKKWISSDPKWTILSVEMISQKQYRKELEKLTCIS